MSAFRWSALGVLFAAAIAVAAMPADPPKPVETTPVKAAAKPVDLVICLDVSGSMGGLIDSARLKLWDVVNELAQMKPTPTLRVGVYSYGGQGTDYPAEKGYIRKEIDLTSDLDEVYAKLNALKISGHIEYATGVSKTALDDQKWSEDKGALKLIFVCGNEEADQDPNVTAGDLGKLAAGKGVLVNAIYCGKDGDAISAGWKAIADKGNGRYASIDMEKAKQVAVATPFDKELNELSGKLNTTYVVYGGVENEKKALNQATQDKNAAAAAPGAGAARATSKGGELYRNGTWDLIDKLKDDPKFDLAKIKDEDLCEEMRKLKPDERLAYLKKKGEEREGFQKQIADLSAKRSKHIAEELKKAPKSSGEQALDEALRSTIREQAKDKGFTPADKK